MKPSSITAFLIFILNIVFFHQYQGFATELAGELQGTHLGIPITIELKQQDWDHIVYGEEDSDHYKGGHDFDSFFTNYLKNGKVGSIHFDELNHAYIIASKKGACLSEIIKKIQSDDRVGFHTCFPSQLLTINFVLQAFQKALHENNLDSSNKKFWTNALDETGNFAIPVAGYYKKHGDTYTIKTVFPNLREKYERDFSLGKPVLLDRFINLVDIEKQKWFKTRTLEGGLNLTNFLKINPDDQRSPFGPPAVEVVSQFGRTHEIRSEEYADLVQLSNDMNRKYIGKNIKVNVLDYFFKNSLQKTEHETIQFIKYMDTVFPDFMRQVRSTKIGSKSFDKSAFVAKFSKINIALKKKPIFSGRFIRANSRAAGNQSALHRIELVYLDHNLMHFSEELMFELLSFNSRKALIKDDGLLSEEEYALREQVSSYFYDNFKNNLFKDSDSGIQDFRGVLFYLTTYIDNFLGQDYKFRLSHEDTFSKSSKDKYKENDFDASGIVTGVTVRADRVDFLMLNLL